MISNPKHFVFSLLTEEGAFQFSTQSNYSNIYSTCFGVFALDLLGELNTLPEEKKSQIISYIKDKQDEETGLFRDQSTEQTRHGKHDENYIRYQITDFCIMALAAFNEKPLYSLHFTEDFKDTQYLEKYLNQLDWKDPWLVSNTIMFILNFLIFQDSKNEVNYILNWLTEHQAQDSGFWHLNESVDYHNQMAGAFHFVIFYTYFNRSIPLVDKMVDSIISMQEFDGLFNYAGGGGSCEDLDAIDILCRSRIYSEHKSDQVRASLQKAYKAIEENQNQNGGFCWAKRDFFSLPKLLRTFNPKLLKLSSLDFKKNILLKLSNQYYVLFNRKKLNWKYSGLGSMEIPLSTSDLWSTWFRLLAIATIETQFPDLKNSGIEWNMKQSSGLGYYK